MAVLTNQRHEQFVQCVFQGLSATRAYAQVYGESASAGQAGYRLFKNVQISERLLELQTAAAERTIQLEISDRNARVQALQNRWDRMRALIEARAKDMAAETPGGETGMLVRDYKGKDANQVVYKFDASLVNELAKHEKQAAEELGQWVTKSETAVFDVAEMVKLLHEGRARARVNWEARHGELAQPCPNT